MDNSITWDTPPEQEEATLDPYSNTVISAPLPEKAAKERAIKVKVAFSGEENPPSFDEILSDVQTQREDRLKDRLAQSEAIRKTQKKQEIIREVVNSGEATPESLAFLQGLSADEVVDSEGILEKKYAEWRVTMGLSSDESGVVEKVAAENPAFGDDIDASVDRIYRLETANSAYQRMAAAYEQTGIGRTLIDFGFSVLPWAEAQEAKNITPDNVSAEGILPSTVRRSQVRDLFAMPPKEFAATVAQIEKEAQESGDYAPAMQLFKDLQEYSAYQGQVSNAFALLSLVELAPGGLVFDAAKGGLSLGRAGGRAVARAEALKKAQEAVSGAASTTPTGKGTKAAGEAPKAPSEAPAPEAAAVPKKGSLREGRIDPDGRRWPPAMGPKIDRTATTGYEGMSDKALQERVQYIEKKLYPDPNGGVGNNGLSVEEQNKLVDELAKIRPEYDKRSITPGNSLYIPEEAAGPSDRERILSIARTGKEPVSQPIPVLTDEEIVVTAVAEKAAGDPRPVDEIATAIVDKDESLFLDSQLRAFEAKIADPDPSVYRQTNKVIIGRYGEKYKIEEVSDAEMFSIRGANPLGTVVSREEGEGILRFDDDLNHRIFINKERLEKRFTEKWWKGVNGKLPNGTRALPEDAFKTLEEFRNFVIEHEIAHITAENSMPWADWNSGTKLVELENEVNKAALYRIGRRDLVKKVFPEDFRNDFGPDPDVVPAPPKVEEVARPKSYPTPQSISIPETQQKWKTLKAKIENLNEEIQKTYPKGSAKNAGIPDKGERRLALNEQLKQAQKELYDLQGLIDSKPYKAAIAARDESLDKIKKISDRLANPASFYPEWFKPGAVDTAAWKKQKASLEKELKAEQKKFAQTDRIPGPGYVTVDVPNAATGGKAQVQVPATEENLAKIYKSNVESSAFGDMNDLPGTFAAHGDIPRGAAAEAIERVTSEAAEKGKKTIEEASKDLARRLPSLYDFTSAVVGTAAHANLRKLVNNLAKKYEGVIKRQADVNKALWEAFNNSQSMGALRWSDDVFEAVKDAAKAQMDRYVGSPASAILDVKFLREWETTGRTNQIVYKLGTPKGETFVDMAQADLYAREYYGMSPGAYSIRSLRPDAFYVEVAKVIDETDPDILKHAIQTSTATPVSWVNTAMAYFRGSAGVSSEHLQKNLAVSSHHAKALHEAFMVAAKDIGRMTKDEIRKLDALMEAKRDVEKRVVDPVSGEVKVVRGEWFENATQLENTYKKAFGEYPSENVVSAYFTMRQMYDFDLMYRNVKLYSEKTRLGFENAKLHIPIPDDRNPGMVKWVQQKRGVEVKFVEEIPSGSYDVLILDSETAQAHLINTGKSGVEGIKALREKGYKLMQVAAPDQRPLKHVNDNYIQFVVAKDVERSPLTVDQLPSTEGGHVRYKEGFFVKQPRFETTSNGQKLYLGDQSILGASSEAEAKKHAANMEIARKLMLQGDTVALSNHLSQTLPWTVGEFEELFRPKLGNTGEILEEPLLNKDTPITWVMDGQGVNDAAKTHADYLRDSFLGVRDTIDDPTNLYGTIGKKYAGEKDLALKKVVDGDGGPLFAFDKARMISPMETLEQAWADISRSIATDNMKIQAATNWVEEAASALETPLEELRRNPWAALNNPQWNRQYGDIAKIRTLDAQRRQILGFLGQQDQLGTTLSWVRNKLLNSVFEKKGQASADWVDDHVLPNVRNPLQFMRSFAFHTKMGFFNPIQLFLQANTMINTWAITGNPARVGSAISGVMLMQAARVNRTPEILADLAKKSEKLGWKPGEWQEMDELFHRLSLNIVEGEVGTLDVMTSPRMFNGVGGAFLDKGLVFFREAEKAIRANAWAVAYKEFRDKYPKKVLNNSDINTILRRQEILSANMTRGSNALWQRGLTGPMTQFWGYQARITEQLLGKQLTRAEKLRLGSAFAAMYGMPVSLAAATMFQIPGWSTDDIRQYALDNNIDLNSGIGSVFMNGAPAELIRWMTSDENGQGGLLLAIGDRYGPGGLPVIKNLIEAKDGVADAIIDLAFGASGSITRDFFKHALPDDWDILESATNPPSLVLADFANMFSTISTVNNSTKLYWALTTHKSMTRDGLNLGDKSPLSAWVSFTTGLDEQRFKDTFLKLDSLKDLRTATDELGKEYVRQIRQAKMLPLNDEERARRIRKARVLLQGMDPKDVKKFVKQAYRSGDSLEVSIDRQHNEKIKE